MANQPIYYCPDENHPKGGLPAIAVDLGFSKNKKSCGIARTHELGNLKEEENQGKKEEYKFGACIEEVYQFIQEDSGTNELYLILEAPLSGMFKGCNPEGRTAFERDDSNTRYWYTQPASTLVLSALFFLRKLAGKIDEADDENRKIYLYEGFISFKNNDDSDNRSENTTDHQEDAERLIKTFNSRGSEGKIIREKNFYKSRSTSPDNSKPNPTSLLKFLPDRYVKNSFCPPVLVVD